MVFGEPFFSADWAGIHPPEDLTRKKKPLTLEEKIVFKREQIESRRNGLNMLRKQRDLFIVSQDVPAQLDRDPSTLGEVLIQGGRSLGGLVAARNRQVPR